MAAFQFETVTPEDGVEYLLERHHSYNNAYTSVNDILDNINMHTGSLSPRWKFWNDVKEILHTRIITTLKEGVSVIEPSDNVLAKINSIKEKRQAEIEKKENYNTTYPIYIVYSIQKFYREADSDCGGSITLSSEFKQSRSIVFESNGGEDYIYLDETELEENSDGNYYDEEAGTLYDRHLEESYYDRFETVCFTREAAELFIKKNGHNMNEPFIYVDAIPYRNREMIEVLELLGDKW